MKTRALTKRAWPPPSSSSEDEDEDNVEEGVGMALLRNLNEMVKPENVSGWVQLPSINDMKRARESGVCAKVICQRVSEIWRDAKCLPVSDTFMEIMVATSSRSNGGKLDDLDKLFDVAKPVHDGEYLRVSFSQVRK
jgi:hypothetical protein